MPVQEVRQYIESHIS
jgi:hypothetical protein